jgi:flagellar biosynthesis chaperone FliJ
MKNITDLFEESTTKAVEDISEDSIKDLSELCQKLLRVEAEVGNTEERLKRLKDQQRELSEQLIPDN